MRRSSSILILGFLSLLLPGNLFLTAASAQPNTRAVPVPQDLLASFYDSFDVRGAHVYVVVSDEAGNRVQGLTVADFRLTIDGKEIEIESLAEIRDGQILPSSTSEGEAPDQLQADAETGNNYLIFIEEIYSGFRLRDEALKGIAADLRLLSPRDQVAIVSASRERVKILSPWTHAGPALDRLLAQMIQHKGTLAGSSPLQEPTDPDLPSRSLVEAYQDHLDRFFADEATTFGTVSDAYRELEPLEKVTAAASASLWAFSVVPGRKIMLLLSDGWMPSRPKTPKQRGGASMLDWLTDTANQQGFSVYPVERGTLKQAALETGGLSLKPGRDRHFGKVVLDTSACYRLGFTYAGDDRRRDLKVEVRRPGGLQVRSPTSFVPLPRQAIERQTVDGALLQGALTGMEPLAASVGELQSTGNGRAELPITVQIPIDQITMLAYGEKRRFGKLELRMSTLADDGIRTVITAIPIWVVQEDLSKPVKMEPYQALIQVEHKPQHIQFMLVDVLSTKCFTKKVRVEPRSWRNRATQGRGQPK